MMAVAGGIVILAAAIALYLASAHQQLAPGLRGGRRLGWGGLVALVIGTALILRWSGPATAIFIAVTLAMLVWSVLPPVIAWWRGAPESRR